VSLLADPPLLFAGGGAYARLAPRRQPTAVAVVFATYPARLWLGWAHGRRA
jgi:hypothetical protein